MVTHRWASPSRAGNAPMRRTKRLTRVGFEPTPFRTRSLVWRLRPLGHLTISTWTQCYASLSQLGKSFAFFDGIQFSTGSLLGNGIVATCLGLTKKLGRAMLLVRVERRKRTDILQYTTYSTIIVLPRASSTKNIITTSASSPPEP